jgi:hypothetical protein
MEWSSWVVVILFGVMGGFGLVPVMAKGSAHYPVMQWILLVALGGPGACILAFGLWKAAKHHRLTTSSGRVAEGKVVDQHRVYRHIAASRAKDRDDSVFSDSGSKSWDDVYPIVEFLSEEGKAVRFQGIICGKDKPAIKTGTVVKVYYDPRNPSTAFIGTFMEMGLLPLSISVAGLVLLLGGLAGFALSARALGAHLALDRDPEAIERVVEEDNAAAGIYTVHFQGTIDRAEVLRVQLPPPYTFVCKAVRPGASTAEEFRTRSIPWKPGNAWLGRTIDIYLKPDDPTAYYVPVGSLLREMAGPK